MKAGKLRHRVAIEKQARIRQDDGSLANEWVLADFDGAAAWPCEIVPLSVRDFVQSDARQSGITGRVTMRPPPVFAPTYRLRELNTGALYNVAGILPDANSGIEYVTVPITEGLNDGG